MVLSIIVSILMAIAGYFLQIAVFPAFGAVTAGPSMVVASTVSIGLIFGPAAGLAVGFTGGLALDLFTGWGLGFLAVPMGAVGFLLGYYRDKVNNEHFVYAMVLAALAHIACDLWALLVLYFSRMPSRLTFSAIWHSLLSAVLTASSAGAVHLITGALYKRAMRTKNNSLFFD